MKLRRFALGTTAGLALAVNSGCGAVIGVVVSAVREHNAQVRHEEEMARQQKIIDKLDRLTRPEDYTNTSTSTASNSYDANTKRVNKTPMPRENKTNPLTIYSTIQHKFFPGGDVAVIIPNYIGGEHHAYYKEDGVTVLSRREKIPPHIRRYIEAREEGGRFFNTEIVFFNAERKSIAIYGFGSGGGRFYTDEKYEDKFAQIDREIAKLRGNSK